MEISSPASLKAPIDLNEVTNYNKKKEKEIPKNPNELNNDAFMKLFLEQLKNQDPTSPMETDKIIAQTAQLTQVEMQEQTKRAMLDITKSLSLTKETNEELLKSAKSSEEFFSSLSKGQDILRLAAAFEAVGKLAQVKDFISVNGDALEGEGVSNEGVEFSLFFDKDLDEDGIIEISDLEHKVVRSLPLDGGISRGYHSFSWDARDEEGNALSGEFSAIAIMNGRKVAMLGEGEVEGISMNEGEIFLTMGKQQKAFSDIQGLRMKE